MTRLHRRILSLCRIKSNRTKATHDDDNSSLIVVPEDKTHCTISNNACRRRRRRRWKNSNNCSLAVPPCPPLPPRRLRRRPLRLRPVPSLPNKAFFMSRKGKKQNESWIQHRTHWMRKKKTIFTLTLTTKQNQFYEDQVRHNNKNNYRRVRRLLPFHLNA